MARQSCDVITSLGWQPRHFAKGRAFLQSLRTQPFDAVLLDLRLPDMSGLDILNALPLGHRCPVIMVTSSADESSLLAAFDGGVRDYVTKPFRSRELGARLGALLSRSGVQPAREILTVRDLQIDLHPESQPIVFRGSEAIVLTEKEFRCAQLLLACAGRTVSRDALRLRVWHLSEAVQTRTIDTHVSRVRCKLGLWPEHGFSLRSIYGVGWRLEVS